MFEDIGAIEMLQLLHNPCIVCSVFTNMTYVYIRFIFVLIKHHKIIHIV